METIPHPVLIPRGVPKRTVWDVPSTGATQLGHGWLSATTHSATWRPGVSACGTGGRARGRLCLQASSVGPNPAWTATPRASVSELPRSTSPAPRGPCFPGLSPFVLSTGSLPVIFRVWSCFVGGAGSRGFPLRRGGVYLSPAHTPARSCPPQLLLSAGIFGGPGGHPRDLERLYFWKYRLRPRSPTPRLEEKSACSPSSCWGVRFQRHTFPVTSLPLPLNRQEEAGGLPEDEGGAASGP